MSLKSLCCFTLLALAAVPVAADKPSFLNMFRRNSVEADPSKFYELSAEEGPWLILASTMVGEGSKERAQRLVLEIRQELDLPAFLYKEKFDFTGDLDPNGMDRRRMRYANQYQYEAYAVLVGEYDSVEHPEIDSDLEMLKAASLDVFKDPDVVAAETNPANPITAVKALHRKLLEATKDKDANRGPMSNAFVTRNPILPDEYFAAPKVDSFVCDLNEDKEFSLLECKGNFTVIVRTFEGFGTIAGSKQEQAFTPSMRRLDKFAADADKMVRQLRKDGFEAYQYHDRNRSLVTVGSFDRLGRELPDGRFEYADDIRRVMQKFSALNAEKARSIPGKGAVAANHVALIPFDVQPTPITVPRVSKRSLYSGALGLK